MAKLYITEFSGMAVDQSRHYVPIVDATRGVLENASSPITIAAGHAESAAFNAATTIIRVHTDAICSIFISAAGTAAAATNARMAANSTEYFGVRAGDILSVITNS